MKAPLALALSLLAAAAARGAAAPAARPAPDPSGRYSLIGDDYKRAQVLPDSAFNPFKIQAATTLAGSRKEGAPATPESIADAVEHRRVTGVLLADVPADNRVIIGDTVFGVGDPLEFFDKDKGAAVPLAAGMTVVLREVRRDALGLDVGQDGESPHRVDFPLRTFWRP
ncbi:MAG TPA: hypothetical protein VHC86_07550 [Opitutaceae bacterium]|nr:hypothetical protein [Opitutaceae bacterium]